MTSESEQAGYQEAEAAGRLGFQNEGKKGNKVSRNKVKQLTSKSSGSQLVWVQDPPSPLNDKPRPKSRNIFNFSN